MTHPLLERSEDEDAEFTDRILVLDRTDIRRDAEGLTIEDIECCHIKGSTRRVLRANMVILNLMQDGRIRTKVLKNRWGANGIVGGPE